MIYLMKFLRREIGVLQSACSRNELMIKQKKLRLVYVVC